MTVRPLTPEALRAKGPIPRHVAIIMDGNGRWAKARGVPRLLGHRAGREAVRDTVQGAVALGIEVLTLYTFSTENWDRPKSEVQGLMSFLKRVLREEVKELHRQDVRLRVIGRARDLSADVRDVIDAATGRLAGNSGLLLCLAISYSGRAEILEAVRRLVAEAGSRPVTPLKVDEAAFEAHLMTAGLPDPDLLIRTSGERRISNFLLWQLAYTELVFDDALWPDFRRRNLYRAVADYQGRDRRFGKVDVVGQQP
ncbi:MAG: isoprenyl transferase [Candidatus Eisenbacteria bacterium]